MEAEPAGPAWGQLLTEPQCTHRVTLSRGSALSGGGGGGGGGSCSWAVSPPITHPHPLDLGLGFSV